MCYGVLWLLDHACGTRCQSIYDSATVSDSLKGCWRPIRLVFETAALCDALVRSAVYKSSYLLTYNINKLAYLLRFLSFGVTEDTRGA